MMMVTALILHCIKAFIMPRDLGETMKTKREYFMKNQKTNSAKIAKDGHARGNFHSSCDDNTPADFSGG